jgi:two-component system, NtrC family, nitrogen regulation response regulator NtrX
VRVLVVDDEENVRKGISTFLGLSGHEAHPAADLAAARAALDAGPFDAALVDVYIGRENGSELLDLVQERGLGLPVLMMSGKGSVKDAVAAVRRGAYDFFEKPLDTDRLLAALRNLERESSALRRLEAYRDSWLAEHAYIEGGSALAQAFDEAARAAASPLSILVQGPTGSGKELVARWIHLCSPRSQGPFVAVNCAAIPRELAESELFGSRKGSYTGSVADRRGYFEAASGGTLFLDEVGELDLSLQAAILRAVETGEIQPVGAAASKSVDARIVAATNRDLLAAARAGAFREDLYWRLARATIALPSLAERGPELRGLASFLAAPVRAERGAEAPELGEGALGYLAERAWPGNVRELRAFVERALWLAPGRASLDRAYMESIDRAAPQAGPGDAAPRARDLGAPRACPSSTAAATPGGGSAGGLRALAEAVGSGGGLPLAEAKEAFERAYVAAALEETGGSVVRAAELLGLLPNNLSRKIRDLGLRDQRG